MYSNGFTKTNLKALREELNAVLKAHGIEGLEAEVGNASFSQNEVTFKLNVKVSGAKTRADSEVEDFVNHYDILTEKNGRKLISLNYRSHRYPVIYSENGKNYKTTIKQALDYFSK